MGQNVKSFDPTKQNKVLDEWGAKWKCRKQNYSTHLYLCSLLVGSVSEAVGCCVCHRTNGVAVFIIIVTGGEVFSFGSGKEYSLVLIIYAK
jgi:hypothetical protein